jgi:probable phosphoglycerate mutase
MAEDEVIARIGADALADWEQHGTAPPGWIVDAPARLAGWRHLFDNATGDVLAVTSNGAGRFALLAQEIDLPPSLKQRTGAAGEFEREPDGTWRLTGWDQRPPR